MAVESCLRMKVDLAEGLSFVGVDGPGLSARTRWGRRHTSAALWLGRGRGWCGSGAVRIGFLGKRLWCDELCTLPTR